MCEGIFGMCEGIFGMREGIFGICEGIFGICEVIFGIREGIFGMCEGIFGICEGIFGKCVVNRIYYSDTSEIALSCCLHCVVTVDTRSNMKKGCHQNTGLTEKEHLNTFYYFNEIVTLQGVIKPQCSRGFHKEHKDCVVLFHQNYHWRTLNLSVLSFFLVYFVINNL